MSEDTNTPSFSLPEKLTTPYKRLAKNLSFTGRFQWIFAVFGDSHLRQRIFEHLSGTVDQKIVSLSEIQDIFEFENLIESAAKDTTCLHLVDTRHLFDNEDSNWPNLLNLHREAIAQKAPVNLVFWMDDDHLTFLAKNAPDFWNWRSAVYDFLVPEVTEKIEKPELLLPELEWLTPLSDTEQLRLKQLQKRFADKPANSPAEADLQLEMARLQLRQYQIKKAEDAISIAENLYQQACDKNGMGNCYVLRGQISNWLEERKAALSNYKKAIDFFRETQNGWGQAICQYQMANVYKLGKMYDKAYENIGSARTLFEQFKDTLWLAKTLIAIAELEQAQHRLDESKKHNLDALKLLGPVNGTEAKSSALRGLAKIEKQQGNLQSTREYLLQALDESKKSTAFFAMELILSELSELELEQGNVDAIDPVFRKTVEYFEAKAQPLGQAYTYRAWAQVLLQQHQPQEAICRAEKAGQIFIRHKFPIGLAFSIFIQLLGHHTLDSGSPEQMETLIEQAGQAAKESQVPSVIQVINEAIKLVQKPQ